MRHISASYAAQAYRRGSANARRQFLRLCARCACAVEYAGERIACPGTGAPWIVHLWQFVAVYGRRCMGRVVGGALWGGRGLGRDTFGEALLVYCFGR